MTEVKFVVKNYRCFNDDHPLEFVLRDGFVGFVGPNNSGKSAILKFFYEFRPMWKIVGNESDLNELLLKSGRRIKLQLPYCDHDAIFHKFNNRPIEILIECKKTSLLLLIERVSEIITMWNFLEKWGFRCGGKLVLKKSF